MIDETVWKQLCFVTVRVHVCMRMCSRMATLERPESSPAPTIVCMQSHGDSSPENSPHPRTGRQHPATALCTVTRRAANCLMCSAGTGGAARVLDDERVPAQGQHQRAAAACGVQASAPGSGRPRPRPRTPAIANLHSRHNAIPSRRASSPATSSSSSSSPTALRPRKACFRRSTSFPLVLRCVAAVRLNSPYPAVHLLSPRRCRYRRYRYCRHHWRALCRVGVAAAAGGPRAQRRLVVHTQRLRCVRTRCLLAS